MSSIIDFNVTRAREDFEAVFNLNKVDVTRIRETGDNSAGDLFNIDGNQERTETTIEMNIQGMSEAIQRVEEGVTTKIGGLDAYCKYNTDIRERDIVLVNTTNFTLKFKITDYNPGMKGDGQYVFQQFKLQFIDYNISDNATYA